MFNNKFWILLIVISLVLTLASCTKECEHRDADDDYLCDECGEHFDDGDEAGENQGNSEETKVSVLFRVSLDDGTPLSYVKFTLTRRDMDTQLVSGADGSVQTELVVGIYSVSYEYDNLPEACLPNTFSFKVEEGTTEIVLEIVNNTPDGSATKPFPVSESETEITLSAGEEHYYNYRGSSVKYLSVDSNGVVVNFNDTSYSLDAGNMPLTISPAIGEETVFSIKNTTKSEVKFTLFLEAPEGSYENPIQLDEKNGSCVVNCDSVVYYTWTAYADGVLTLTSDNERNNILVRKIIEEDVPVDRQTNGELTVSMEVASGDVITIGVSALEAGINYENQEYDIEISFTLYIE